MPKRNTDNQKDEDLQQEMDGGVKGVEKHKGIRTGTRSATRKELRAFSTSDLMAALSEIEPPVAGPSTGKAALRGPTGRKKLYQMTEEELRDWTPTTLINGALSAEISNYLRNPTIRLDRKKHILDRTLDTLHIFEGQLQSEYVKAERKLQEDVEMGGGKRKSSASKKKSSTK